MSKKPTATRVLRDLMERLSAPQLDTIAQKEEIRRMRDNLHALKDAMAAAQNWTGRVNGNVSQHATLNGAANLLTEMASQLNAMTAGVSDGIVQIRERIMKEFDKRDDAVGITVSHSKQDKVFGATERAIKQYENEIKELQAVQHALLGGELIIQNHGKDIATQAQNLAAQMPNHSSQKVAGRK